MSFIFAVIMKEVLSIFLYFYCIIPTLHRILFLFSWSLLWSVIICQRGNHVVVHLAKDIKVMWMFYISAGVPIIYKFLSVISTSELDIILGLIAAVYKTPLSVLASSSSIRLRSCFRCYLYCCCDLCVPYLLYSLSGVRRYAYYI